ncbi:hypothetical protein AADZ84_17205 [Colwelliaceae bacterium MEBiC 14330]
MQISNNSVTSNSLHLNTNESQKVSSENVDSILKKSTSLQDDIVTIQGSVAHPTRPKKLLNIQYDLSSIYSNANQITKPINSDSYKIMNEGGGQPTRPKK